MSKSVLRRGLGMVVLITAGEAVFGLPFVLARVFRPTVLDVFGLTNLQLGVAFSLYGIVAMIAYFAGGPLADRFAPRRLMRVALLGTALGGVVFGTIPSVQVLRPLYAYWTHDHSPVLGGTHPRNARMGRSNKSRARVWPSRWWSRAVCRVARLDHGRRVRHSAPC